MSPLSITEGGADDRFLIGDSEGAKTDLEKSLDILPSFVQSWVKIASVHMELGKLSDPFQGNS